MKFYSVTALTLITLISCSKQQTPEQLSNKNNLQPTPAPKAENTTSALETSYKDVPKNSCGIFDMRGGFKSPHLAGDITEDVLASFYSQKVSHPGASTLGQAFDFGPRQAALLLKDMPRFNFPITSCSPEATNFFNQGIGQVFSYMNIEAERSFRQAFSIDSQCIMALWGVALAQEIFWAGNTARAAKISKLVYLLKQSGDYSLDTTETKLIDAMYTLLHGDPETRKHKFNRMLYDLAVSTDNSELKALSVDFIWEYESFDSLDLDRDDLDSMITEIHKENPQHPVHHQRIHLWNDWKNEAKLIGNASVIGPYMKRAAHMWHMASHVYFPLARYADSDQQFEAAQRTDHRYLQSISEFPYIVHNYAHNANFWSDNLIRQGALRAAERVSLDLVSLPLHPLYNDPRNTVNTYFSPFTQGVYGYVNRLFRDGLHGEIVSWYRKGILSEMLSYPQLGQSAPIKLLTQLLLSLRELEAEQEALDYIEKTLSEWPTKQEADHLFKTQMLEFISQYEIYKKNPSVEKLKLLQENELLGTGSYLQELHRLKAYDDLISAVEDNSLSVFFAASLYLAEAYLQTGRVDEAKNAFKKAQQTSMKLDLDHPLYELGAQLNKTLNNSKKDWRGVATLHKDFQFRNLEELGPVNFPGLFVTDFRFKLKFGQKNALVVFVLGGSCMGCNEQLNKLYSNREKFPKTKIIVVSNDSQEALDDFLISFPHFKDAGFEFRSSEDYELFKMFRVHDDFEKSGIHGTFVLNKKHEIVWADRNSLPFTDWEWLSKELTRQEKVQTWRKNSTSYEDFPIDRGKP